MQLKVRKLYAFAEDESRPDSPDDVLRKVAVVAVVENPCSGKYVEDLRPLIAASTELGQQMAQRAIEAMQPFRTESYGKGGIVGTDGEQEHANALLTTTFADPLREAVGGGKAWISSMTKCGGPGTSIDIPLASKDALYVRSHYDGITLTLHDAPLPNEVAVIIAIANRGRLSARVGGLALAGVKGADGLK